MKEQDWNSIQDLWSADEKPKEIEAEIKKEFNSSKRRALFIYIVEALIVLSVIAYTVFAWLNDVIEELIIIDLWATLLVIGVFTFWNRIRFPQNESLNNREYLLFMIKHSKRKKNTGLFVIAIAVIHTMFIAGYFGITNLLETPGHTLLVVSITLGYVIWGVWFTLRANIEMLKYNQLFDQFFED
ncbi:MAG: hypothetical protein JJ895_16505 [Balneolaceae bacterium]|nr:hypothetical protein [Balneolaceae bacterium]